MRYMKCASIRLKTKITQCCAGRMTTYFFKLIGQFLQDMRRQKLRTFFTVFGITWGTVAVVLLLGFGAGLQKQAMKGMRGMGSNIVIFGGRRTTITYQGLGKGRWIGLREKDARLLRENIPYMEFISPEANRQVHCTSGRERRMVNVAGIYPGYGPVRNLWPDRGGRFINDPDLKSKRRVVFIGDELRDDLFGEGSDAVGRVVMMGGVPFRVVGVMVPKIQNSSYMGRDRTSAFVPYSTYEETFQRQGVCQPLCLPGGAGGGYAQDAQGYLQGAGP